MGSIFSALILCGGQGTRMNGGYPGELKPLLTVCGVPILERIINILLSEGVTRIYLLGGYRYLELESYFKNRSGITCLNTGELTNTGGRLSKALKEFPEIDKFIFTYGDSWVNFSLSSSRVNYRENSIYTMCMYEKKMDYGALTINLDGYLASFVEKGGSQLINAGFYMMDRGILNFINNENESFETDVLPRIVSSTTHKIKPVNIDKWFPMDTPYDRIRLEDYIKSIE
jgi:NDP-sugar pyrophosphorylase family protein